MIVCYNYFVVISDITSILKETPNEDELIYLLLDIDDNWDSIGVSLEVHHDILDDLKHGQDDNINKLRKIFKISRDTQPFPLTWETVITAIESDIVDNSKKAKEIRRYLKLSKL